MGDIHLIKPNFLIIGAARSGTSSLYRYLGQHPDIFMSQVKEPHFFCHEESRLNLEGPGDKKHAAIVSGAQQYQSLFNNVSHFTAAGDASVWYLYFKSSAERVRHYNPRMKLIAILRQPADRAYSSFLYTLRDGREPLRDFSKALAAEPSRIRALWEPIWHYKNAGFYHDNLRHYLDIFGKSQVRVYLYDDLVSNPRGVLKDICRFLEVDEAAEMNLSEKYNESYISRSRAIQFLMTRPNPVKSAANFLLRGPWREKLKRSLRKRNEVKKPLDANLRRDLTQAYRKDILKLQDLLDRDLSLWLAATPLKV
ncbi:MAG: hypothetical protein A3C47_06090 [Omnitrophica bacterium RIFCSPHIGHO2_02_FULL_51_18]|nr:MAG: hypothetical protein A3C47_06090 [Omnitrophica bacterium RIFCSPHIGHO2_02_FULL_51_18]